MERFAPFAGHFSSGKDLQRQSATRSVPADGLIDGVPGFRSLMDTFRGLTLDGGIYRLLNCELFDAATGFIRAAPFGCDWLGRIFAVDGSGRTGTDGEPCVLLLDPGTRDILQVPATVTEFHNQVLLVDREIALEESLWKAWLAGGHTLEYDQLAGLRIPCFLGGQLILNNLEIQPAVVYWGLAGQLIAQTLQLREGTQIKDVEIK